MHLVWTPVDVSQCILVTTPAHHFLSQWLHLACSTTCLPCFAPRTAWLSFSDRRMCRNALLTNRMQAFLLTIASWLFTIEQICLQLRFGPSLLTIGIVLLMVEYFMGNRFYPVLVLGRIELFLWGCRTPAQYWIKIVHLSVQKFFPILWLGFWRKAPKGFPDSSSVLDKFQSAILCLQWESLSKHLNGL